MDVGLGRAVVRHHSEWEDVVLILVLVDVGLGLAVTGVALLPAKRS